MPAYTLASGANQVLSTGRYVLKRIDVSATAAVTVDFYDTYSATHTQANGSYTDGARLDPVTRTGATTADIFGNTVSYPYTGSYTYTTTVAANPTAALPKLLTVSLAAAGAYAQDVNIILTNGLSVQSTGTATLIYDYQPIP